MKKLASVMLSFLMVMGLFGCLFVGTTASATESIGDNLIANGDFESFDVDTQLKYTGSDYPTGMYFGGNKNAGYLGQTKQEIIYDNKGMQFNSKTAAVPVPMVYLRLSEIRKPIRVKNLFISKTDFGLLLWDCPLKPIPTMF